MDGSLPGFSIHGILQARILEWVAIPSSRGSFWPRNWTGNSNVSCIGKRNFFFFFLPLAPSGKLLTQHRDYQLLENKTIPCSYKDWITWPFKRIFPTNAHASSSGTLLHPHPHALLSKNSLCLPECAVLFQASMLWLVLCPLPGVTSLSVPVYQTPTRTLKSSLSTSSLISFLCSPGP